MRNLLFFLFAASLTAACGGDADTTEVTATDAVAEGGAQVVQGNTYSVNPGSSQILWTGSKLVGDSHTGTLDVKDGRLAVANNELVAGEFTIDMASLTVTDLDENSGKGKLEGHLKNEDFFEVAKYPDATFTITQVQPATGNPNVTHNLTGNLTMKGQTKSVTIPANVVITDEMISAVTPAFAINRNDWGVKYGSGLSGAVGDNVISDDVKLVINLKAARS